jgi:hypothetical protein
MTGNVDAKLAQLLNQSPYFGAAGADLSRDLGSAYDDGGMGNKQTHDAPQSGIALGREFVRRNFTGT